MHVRNGKCENCGQCCGLVTHDGQQTNPWGETWPGGLVGWSEESCEQVPILKLITPPHINGKISGTVEVNGRVFSYYWHSGIRKSLEDHSCPFLYEKDGRHLCGVYGTEWHEIWAGTCNKFPKPIMELPQAIKIFKRYPGCTFYYVPDDNEE